MSETLTNPKTTSSKTLKRLICGILGVLLVILTTWVLPVPESFEVAAASVEAEGRAAFSTFGVILMAVVWWVGTVFPSWMTGLIMMATTVLLGNTNMSVAFTAFVGGTWWAIFGAFVIAAACTGTGVLNRLALFMMKLFPPTYRGQLAAILVVGTLIQPMVPTTAAKVLLGVSVAMATADAMGYEKQSGGRYGLFAGAWISFGLIMPAFKTSSSTVLTASGLVGTEIPLLTWTWYSLPWLIVVEVLSWVLIPMIYKHNGASAMTKADCQAKYQALGKMKKGEIITALTLVFALGLWIEGSIPSGVVAIFAAFVIYATKTVDPKDINKLPWGLFLFIASVLGVGSIFKKVGLAAWLTNMLYPLFASMSNVALLFLAVTLVVFIVRFVVVSQGVNVTFWSVIMAPVFVALGMHPFCGVFAVLSAQNVFFFQYQNTAYAPACDLTEGGVSHSGMVKFAFWYQVFAFAGILVSIPFWKILGMM